MVVKIQDFAYLIGGLVFGIALFRAGVLARWASLLLAVGGALSVALSLMPDAFYRLIAFPNGIAMIGLGVSLWLGQRTAATVEIDARAHGCGGPVTAAPETRHGQPRSTTIRVRGPPRRPLVGRGSPT